MTLKELMNKLREVKELIENTPESPNFGHPDLEEWATNADVVLDEVLGIVNEILA